MKWKLIWRNRRNIRKNSDKIFLYSTKQPRESFSHYQLTIFLSMTWMHSQSQHLLHRRERTRRFFFQMQNCNLLDWNNLRKTFCSFRIVSIYEVKRFSQLLNRFNLSEYKICHFSKKSSIEQREVMPIFGERSTCQSPVNMLLN